MYRGGSVRALAAVRAARQARNLLDSIAMKHLAIAILVTTAVASRASADDLDTLAGDLARGSTTTHFASCDLLVAPSGEVRRPCKLALADLGVPAGATLRAKATKSHDFPRNPFGWREADIEAVVAGKAVATFHVVEVGDMGKAGFVVRATQWIRLVPDKDVEAAAHGGTLRKPAPLVDQLAPAPKDMTEQDRSDRAAGVDDFKGMVDGDLKAALVDWLDGGATMIGSAPGQTLAGKGGAKAVRGWPLALARDGGAVIGGTPSITWGAMRVVGTTKDKTRVSIPYTAFAVMTRHMTPGGGAFVSEMALVQFGVAP